MNLTKREHEVVELASHGFTAPDISYILHISERTVEEHLRNSREKFGAKNTVNLIYLAQKAGILSTVFLALSLIPSISSFAIDINRPSRVRTTASRIAKSSRGKKEWGVYS